MPTRALLFALTCLLCGRPGAAAPSPEAVDRGKLSLAWDAHEAGLCEEVLGYVDEIPRGSVAEAEAQWLKADCLSSLGRHAEALAVLEGPGGSSVQDRDRFLEDVYYDWASESLGREEFDRALDVLERGRAVRPGGLWLGTLWQAARFRRELHRVLAVARLPVASARLAGGEEVAVRRRGDGSPGPGWIRVFPWDAEASWVPEATLEEWMPTLALRLNRKGRLLWLKVPGDGLRRAIETEAKAAGLSLRRDDRGWRLGLGEEEAFVDAGEWVFRGGVEGLGAQGAGATAVAQVKGSLESRRALFRWIEGNRGSLEVTRAGPAVRVRDPRTGRSHALDLAAWGEAYDPTSGEWRSFWSDLSAELARPAAAYRCFCGRDAIVRETLMAEADAEQAEALVPERGRGYAVVLTALCPLHQQLVTQELLDAWGVTLRSARERARGDALDKPWGLTFERGEEKGTPYLTLEGEGVSSLARRPDLLLGALEAVEGREVRGTSVSVVAPTASSLVVLRSRVSKDREQAAARRVLLRGARRGGGEDRLGYRTYLRLPQAASGVFEMRPVE